MTCFSIHKSLALAALAAILLSASPVFAQETKMPPEEVAKFKAEEQARADEAAGKVDAPIVLELFTASDCSACIFADRILYDAMKDKNVIALSCHIEDITAMQSDGKEESRDGTADGPMDPCVFRQWTFASGRGAEDVTLAIPTFYFNGQDRTNGEDLNYFNTILRSYHYKRMNKTLEAMMRWKDKDTISIHLPQARKKNDVDINASVWIVRYKNMAVERMDKGVNQGRVLRFSNIMQNVTHIAKWHGDMRIVDVDVTPPQGGNERGGYVVLVAQMLGMPYLAAGKLEDYPVAADLKAEAEKRAKAKAAAEGKLQAVPSDKAPVKTGPILPR